VPKRNGLLKMNQAHFSGKLAEKAVARYFSEKGFRVVASNYNVPRLGELDLVLLRDASLTIVEVKARHDAGSFGGLPAAITPAKIKRMRQATWCFLKENHLLQSDVSLLAALVRIDSEGNVLAIHTEPIEWI
jgi:putative endonuclease